MLEKIKSMFWTVLLPLTGLIGFIIVLLQRNKSLERELEVSKVETDTAQIRAEQVRLKNEADTAVDRYRKIADGYVLEHGSSDNVSGSDRSSGSGSEGKTS